MATERERGLPDLLEVLRWRWLLILAVTAAATIASVVYVESLPSKYDAEAVIAYSPRPNTSAGADSVRILVPKYVAYVEAPATIQRLAPSIGVSPSTLDGAVDASTETDTGNVTIKVRLESPDQAAHAANVFAKSAVDFSRTDPSLVGQVVARALPPGSPAAPPRRLLEAAGLLVGLLLGIGIAVLLERGRPRVRTWREMTASTGYSVVGRIPPSRVLARQPTEAFSDASVGSAFRTLRANIEPFLREHSVRVLVITSPGKGDGKTRVAALVSESLARAGQRVLLVDGDFHRPQLAKVADVEVSRGFADLLEGEGDGSLWSAVRSGWIDNLSLLPTKPDSEAGDFLRRRFEAVLDGAADEFDLIVIDSPPLLGTNDARTLATLASGVLLVVQAGTFVNTLNESVLALESLNAPIVGLVANKLREARSYYQYE